MNKFERKIVPAEPGWRAMTGVIESEKSTKVIDLAAEPLVAWLITIEVSDREQPLAWAEPITAEGTESDAILQRPDGSFTLPHLRGFADKQAAIDYLNAENEARVAAARLKTQKL